MSLSPKEKSFVESREKRAKYWPFFGVLSLALVAGYGAWLWLKMPRLINPWHVIERLEAGDLSDSTMGVMAVMLPIVVAAFLGFIFIVVLLWFAVFRNERQLVRLIRMLEADSRGGKENASG